MKKILLTISVVFACYYGQSVSAQAIPDSSFTVWTNTSGPPSYDDPNAVPLTGAGWQELNFATSPLWGSSPASVFKVGVNYNSSPYSAKIVTTVFSSLTKGLLQLKNDTMGLMFLGTVDFLAGKLTSGVSYTQRPASLKFWYEYAPVATDTAFLYVLLTKWNALKSVHDTVAQGFFYKNTTVSSFTQGIVNLSYFSNFLSSGNPDTLVIFVSSSSLKKNKAQPGSTLWLDDFTWGGPFTGINGVKASNVESANVYPNPATNSVTFSFPDNSPKTIIIFDITGKKMESDLVKNTSIILNTGGLAGGLYIYQISDLSGGLLQTGKLSIVK